MINYSKVTDAILLQMASNDRKVHYYFWLSSRKLMLFKPTLSFLFLVGLRFKTINNKMVNHLIVVFFIQYHMYPLMTSGKEK